MDNDYYFDYIIVYNIINFRPINKKKDLESEKKDIARVSQEMNIENRNIKEKLEQKIEELKKNIDGQKIEIEEKEKEIQTLNNEHKDELFKKDEKIRQLKRKIDEMSSQFADMLKVIHSYIYI